MPKAARGGGLVLAERNKRRYAVAEMRRAIYKVKKLRALARGVFVFAVAAVRIFSDVAFSFVIFKLPFGRTEIL